MPWGSRLIRSLLGRAATDERELLAVADSPAGRKHLKSLRAVLHYRIRNRSIFVQALLHRSYPQRGSRSLPSNERLEFLGDAVLNLIVAEYLYKRYPGSHEGELTKVRSRLVNRKALAVYARHIQLADMIFMSPSAAQSIGKGYETIVSDTFEAIVAALYLDGGFAPASRFVEAQLEAAIKAGTVILLDENYKSKLLEFAQSRSLGIPRYVIVNQEGPDHDRTFTVEVLLKGVHQGSGSGKNKKEAEQAAALNALGTLR